MKVILDYSIFFHQKYGGISRYFLNLYNKFIEKKINTKIVAPIHNNLFLNNCKLKNVNGFYIKEYPKYTRKIFKTYNYLFSKFFSKYYKPDIIHKTFYEKNFDNSHKIKKIITVYDLAHEIYYNEYNQQPDFRPKKKALLNIDYIICPSKKTKADLINYYSIPEEKIEVIYMGIHKFNENLNNNITKVNEPYILYVGDRKRYKNFETLLKAFSLSSKIQLDFKLICFGGGKFTDSEKKKIIEFKIKDNKIIQMDGDDDQLCHLYKNAKVFVFPSKYEGLGLPHLEAMSLGCPVISSNHEAILEAVGSAAELFNPNNHEELIFKMEEVLYSSEKIKDLIDRGFNRSKYFSWEKCANETINIYKKITN